jgi:hypothetical protein
MTYFTFPVELFKGLDYGYGIKKVINNIFDYCLYEHCFLSDLDKSELDDAEKFLEMTFGDTVNSYQNGMSLYEGIDTNSPKASVRKSTLFDFYENEKTQFEIDSFLAFSAIRSIIQKDACKKITNGYLLSRMAGLAKKSDSLPERLKKYKSRHHIDKLKIELELNWGLKTYGRYTRGNYMSFKMEYKELMTFVEKRRNSHRKKELARQKKNISHAVILSIQSSN